MIIIDNNDISRIHYGDMHITHVYHCNRLVWRDIGLRRGLYIVITTASGEKYDPNVPLRIPASGSVSLTAHLFMGGKEITDGVEPSGFSWTRISNDSTEQDEAWNIEHRNIGTEVFLSESDVYKRGRFSCNFTGEVESVE